MGQSERFWTDQYLIFYYESRHDFRNIPWTWHLLSLFSRLPSSSIIVCFMRRPLAFQLEGFCTSHRFYIYYFDRKDRAIKICFLWFCLEPNIRALLLMCRMTPQPGMVHCPSMRCPKWRDVVPGLRERRSASGECAAFAYVALEQQANSCKVIFLCTEWKAISQSCRFAKCCL